MILEVAFRVLSSSSLPLPPSAVRCQLPEARGSFSKGSKWDFRAVKQSSVCQTDRGSCSKAAVGEKIGVWVPKITISVQNSGVQLQRGTEQLPNQGWLWHKVISRVINGGCAGLGAPRGPPCPSTFLGSPGRAGKEAEPPNHFISSRTFPDRWEKIAIKKPQSQDGKI